MTRPRQPYERDAQRGLYVTGAMSIAQPPGMADRPLGKVGPPRGDILRWRRNNS